MFQIILPWPPSILNPNSRSHWRPKDDARKKYRRDCYMLAKSIRASFPEEKIHLAINFCPPTTRSRDLDNMLSSIKAGLDGIAEAWGVNDKRFRPILDWGPQVKHGAVEITVTNGGNP